MTFWWDRLERAVAARLTDEAELRDLVPAREGGVAAGSRRLREIATDIEFIDPGDRDALSELLEARLGPDPETAGLRHDDVRALSSGGRHEIGFHTHSHYNLTILDDAQLAAELTEGRAEVMAAAGQQVTSIAYPAGRWNHRVLAAAREAGFELGLTCDPIPTFPDSDPIHVGRLVLGVVHRSCCVRFHGRAGRRRALPALADPAGATRTRCRTTPAGIRAG